MILITTLLRITLFNCISNLCYINYFILYFDDKTQYHISYFHDKFITTSHILNIAVITTSHTLQITFIITSHILKTSLIIISHILNIAVTTISHNLKITFIITSENLEDNTHYYISHLENDTSFSDQPGNTITKIFCKLCKCSKITSKINESSH